MRRISLVFADDTVQCRLYLCWTAPRRSPQSASSDRTGSVWIRPLPPPRTGQRLWSTHTPPLPGCRHLTRTNGGRSYFGLAAGSPPSRVLLQAFILVLFVLELLGTPGGRGSEMRSPTHTVLFLPHLVSPALIEILLCLLSFSPPSTS